MKNIKHYIYSVLSILLLVLFDQYTKMLAIESLKGKAPYKLIPDVLHFEYVINRGAAFGMMQNKQITFIILTIIILTVIAFIYTKTPKTRRYLAFRVTLVLLTAGAIGNFIDRLINNYVHDFIYFVLIDFPVFNVADCYVTVSAFLLVFLVLFVYKNEDDFDFLAIKKKEV